jgi:hypothetical protein
MRPLAILLSFVLACTPAVAQDLATQAERAYGLFAAGLSQGEFLAGRYGAKALDGVAGNWARLGGPSTTGVETYGSDTDRICKAGGVTLSVPSSYALAVLNRGPEGEFTQNYTLVAGATFAEHTDPSTYLTAIGLGPDKTGAQADQQRALALVLINGLVHIYRPSADILVLTRDRGYPVLFARCPK